MASAGDETGDGARERRVEERPARPDDPALSLPQDEKKAGVREPGEDRVDRAPHRVDSVRAALEHAGDEDDPDHDHRNHEESRAAAAAPAR